MLKLGIQNLCQILPKLDRMLLGEAGLRVMGAPPRSAFMSMLRVKRPLIGRARRERQEREQHNALWLSSLCYICCSS